MNKTFFVLAASAVSLFGAGCVGNSNVGTLQTQQADTSVTTQPWYLFWMNAPQNIQPAQNDSESDVNVEQEDGQPEDVTAPANTDGEVSPSSDSSDSDSGSSSDSSDSSDD
ncbi:MAG: hypothetical protein WA001_04020 [Patescibacteria group bacterium]